MSESPLKYHIAQLNIAHSRAPLTDPLLAGFVARLDEINARAEQSPGFVWRLKTDDGNATSIHVFDDDLMIVNLSVWESIDALFEFTYKSDHVQLFRQRTDWFERLTTPALALWWTPVDTLPTVGEAKTRLEHLTRHGPTAYAFNFKTRFPVTAQPFSPITTIEGIL
jgi:hypothetical protein